MPGARWRRLVTAALTDAAGAQLRLVWFNLPSHMRGEMGDRRVYLNPSHRVQ
jgi:hypothetical protein